MAFLLVAFTAGAAEFDMERTTGVEAGYNDNIRNAADDATADLFVTPRFEIELETGLADFDLCFGGEAELEKYLSNSDADNLSLTGFGELEGEFGDANSWGVRYRPMLFLAAESDTDDEESQGYFKHDLRFRLRRDFPNGSFLSGDLLLANKDYSSLARTDTLSVLGARYSRSFLPTCLAQAEIQFQQNDSDDPYYDYDNKMLGVLVYVPLGDRLSMLNLTQYHVRDYSKRAADPVLETGSQEDRELFAYFALIRELTEQVSIELGYTHHRNSSNVDTSTYTGNILSTTLEIRF